MSTIDSQQMPSPSSQNDSTECTQAEESNEKIADHSNEGELLGAEDNDGLQSLNAKNPAIGDTKDISQFADDPESKNIPNLITEVDNVIASSQQATGNDPQEMDSQFPTVNETENIGISSIPKPSSVSETSQEPSPKDATGVPAISEEDNDCDVTLPSNDSSMSTPSSQTQQSNNNSTINSEDPDISEAATPIAPLRNHRHNVVRNHHSVLSCPEVVNLATSEDGDQRNRRHSMDVFDSRNRVKKKKGHYKRTDISGPIFGVGKGPSATMKTRPVMRSANSDSNLLETVCVSSLSVNMTEYILNKTDQPPLIISWDITSSISSLDCISLYLRRDDNVPELVSFRNAGVGYMPKGEITWDLNQHLDKFTSEKNFVVFKYYHPTSTGGLSLVAASEQVIVYNSVRTNSTGDSMRSVVPSPLSSPSPDLTTIVISDICGYNLKRGVFFNPDPYVKICVFPGPRCTKQTHHKQLYRTKQAGNTINPVWKEQFIVQVLPTDLVELEVKDRFERSRPILRRFLGRLLIPVPKLQHVFEQGDERFSEALGKRTPIDQTSGSLSFLVTTARRSLSDIRPSSSLVTVASSRSSTSSSSDQAASPAQSPMEDENYSSDASSGNSELPDVSVPEYVPCAVTETPTSSASVTEEDAAETAVPSEESTAPNNSENTETAESQNPISSSVDDESAGSLPDQSTVAEDNRQSSNIIKETVVKPPVIATLMETSPTLPIQSPKERSPMRKNRLGAVSFFPDDPPDQVSSLKTMSLTVVSKTAAKKEVSQKSTVPSLMRLTSLELQQQYGAVGGVSGSAGKSRQVTSFKSEPKVAKMSPKPDFSTGDPGNTDAGIQAASKSEARPNKRSALSDDENREGASLSPDDISSPVNEVLSITVHRTGGRSLGLSIVGGANSSHAKHIRVKRVEGGSPAQEAGVQVGDRILAVNSESMINVHHNSAVDSIRNSGIEVLLQVERKLTSSAKRRYSKNNSAPKSRPSESEQALSAKRKSSTGRQSTLPAMKKSNHPGAVKLPSALDARFRASRHRIMSRTDITPEDEIPSQEGLPPNWEAFKDRHGRIYYVDHVNRTTQWNHPTLSPMPTGDDFQGLSDVADGQQIVPGAATLRRRNSTEGDRNYESAMKRYQSIKRAMKRQSRVIGEEEEGEPSRAEAADGGAQGIHSPLPAGVMEEEDEVDSSGVNAVAVDSATADDATDAGAASSNATPRKDNALISPGCKFLTHPGFRELLVQNLDAHAAFQSSSVLKYIISKLSRDPSNYLQYQHNKELVKFINNFALTSQDLPQGWETRKDSTGKAFFIDHNLKLTTFIDPRLPLIANRPSEAEDAENSPASTTNTESRGPVQSPLASEQPPPIPPRPERTLTDDSSRVESTTNNDVVSESVSQDMPTAYNEKVVAFLQQPNIVEILKARHPDVGASDSLRERVMIIRTEGVSALERLSYSVNLTIMLSKFEDEIMNFVPKTTSGRSVLAEPSRNINSTHQGSPGPTTNEITKAITRSRAPAPYRRDFESKLHNFYRKLESKGYGRGPNKIKMQVRRDHILEDAFQKVKSLSRKELQRSKLNISFVGEEGLDYSGPSREFFFLVSRELFNPYYGLFEYSAVDTYTVQISPMSAFIDDPMDWFRFAGRIIGLALIHHYLLDAFFTRPLYKALLRAKCDISDLQYIDEQFYNSLMWMKDNDITDVLDLTFTADEEVFGQVVEKELKPNGKNIVVTEKNKKDYIERIVKWRVNRSCREQTNQIVRGFNDVIDLRLVSVFDARELELVLCGTAEIDLNDWRQNTEYRGGYHDLHQVIQWFWQALEKFDNERRLRLLQFVTGTSSIPYEGFSALRGPNGPKKFCIEKWGKVHFLPRAHTCFNRVDLPAYPSFQVLLEKLTIAVEETSTFGIE